MSLGKRLKAEREKRRWSQIFVAEKIGITNTVLSNYERDYRDPDTDTLKNLADLYETSTDYLLGLTSNKKIDEDGLPSLSNKDERDIAKELEKMLSDLSGENALAFDGEPMDDMTRELVKEAIESNLRLAKKLAKKKFTPKKYRDWE